VYILEGGYCRYYEEFAPRCQPQQYVRMDDPVHALSRREDLDQFRRTKFGRTRSYAYGDGAGAAKLLSAGNRLSGASGMGSGDREREERGERERDSQAGPKRHTAPGGQPAVFAAGNAARTRRGPAALLSRKPSKSALNVLGGGKGLVALTEDGDTTAGEEDETDIGDSPCPPPTKTGLGFKVKKIGRAPLLRAETCGPMRLGGF
jgi:M-phase inducer tyrosine phosphatase